MQVRWKRLWQIYSGDNLNQISSESARLCIYMEDNDKTFLCFSVHSVYVCIFIRCQQVTRFYLMCEVPITISPQCIYTVSQKL